MRPRIVAAIAAIGCQNEAKLSPQRGERRAVLLQFDSYQGLGGSANAQRLHW